MGIIDNWLRHIQDVRHKHAFKLNTIMDTAQITDRLCELNVIEQVLNACQTTVVQDAWLRGQQLAVHGWIYGLRDGRLRDLKMCVTRADELADAYAAAVRTSTGANDSPSGSALASAVTMLGNSSASSQINAQ